MGWFSKTVERDKTLFIPYVSDPLKKNKIGQAYKNPIQKSYLEKFLNLKNRKISNNKALYKNILDINFQHEAGFVKFKLPYSRKTAFYIVTYDFERIKQVTGIQGEIKSYQLGFMNTLAEEYIISKQIEYNFTSKEFLKDGYTFKYLGSTSALVIQEKENDSKYKVDQRVFLSDIGIFTSFKNYIKSVYQPLLLEEIKTTFNIDPLDKNIDLHLTEIEVDKDVDEATKRVLFRLSQGLTWKGHTEEKVNNEGTTTSQLKIEVVSKIVEVDNWVNDLRLLFKENSPYFIEYEFKKERGIYFGKNSDSIATKRSARAEYLAAEYPLSTSIYSNKYARMALEKAGYKERSTPKRSKKDPKGKDLVHEMMSTKNLAIAKISQYLDLTWFLYKRVRENKFWQKYLHTIYKYFEEIASTGEDIKKAPRSVYWVGRYFFNIQLIKREIINEPMTKICYTGSELMCNELFLYLNIPDWSSSTQEQVEKKIFSKFTQYGLNLSFFFCRNTDDDGHSSDYSGLDNIFDIWYTDTGLIVDHSDDYEHSLGAD